MRGFIYVAARGQAPDVGAEYYQGKELEISADITAFIFTGRILDTHPST
jgi:hypothetical protein